MYDPQMGNPGPHDAELVEMLLERFGAVRVEKLNEIVDAINEIFEDEIVLAWQYRELTK